MAEKKAMVIYAALYGSVEGGQGPSAPSDSGRPGSFLVTIARAPRD